MSERTLIDYVLRGMSGRWEWGCKHADPYTPGIADMSGFIPRAGNVWIECKALDRWPVRPGTAVKLSRFTPEQRAFLRARRGFLFLRVGRDYLLYHGPVIENMDRMNRAEMVAGAECQWQGSVDWQEFCVVIRGRNPNG